MDKREQDQLIKNIFASEVQYTIIKDRADALALLDRTPAQEYEYQDYLKKLQHDDDLIAIWKNKLTADGITEYSKATRDDVMDSLTSVQEADKSSYEDQKQEVIADDSKEPVDKAKEISSLNSYVSVSEEMINTITTVKAATPLWGLIISAGDINGSDNK